MSFLNYVSTGLKYQRDAINYVLRIHKLNKILPEERIKIKGYLKESIEIRNKLKQNISSETRIPIRISIPSIIYTITRALKPKNVVETGVSNGISTYFFLNALKRNNFGRLYSIDIVDTVCSLKGRKEVAWLVPDELRDRWNFILGDSKKLLPEVLSEIGEVEVFLHDGDHSYENMFLEFRETWKHLREGGIILSDDINLNTAFKDFIEEVKPREDTEFGSLGVVRK